MSFAAEVRLQLTQQPPGKPCCDHAELAAMIRAGGSLVLHGAGRRALTLSTEAPSVARRCFMLIKRVHGVAPQVSYKERSGSVGGRRISLIIGAQADMLLDSAGLLGADGTPSLGAALPRALVSRDCCRRAYLRGAFLFAGTAADPGKGYGMEFNFTSERQAKVVLRILGHYGITAGEGRRGDGACVYVRSGEGVATLLALMGANTAVLALENVRIIRDARNHVNRALNCDTANMNKALGAAQRHIEAITALEAAGGFAKLNPKLRAAAEQRMAYPEMPLGELAEMFSPPLSKSALYHRLEKIAEMAEVQKGEA